MISLPFQNNTLFGVGPDDDGVANVLNIQPVIPVTFGDWNLINRTMLSSHGISDLSSGLPEYPADPPTAPCSVSATSITAFISRQPGPRVVIWGFGPSLTFPTATERSLGSGKWSVPAQPRSPS